MGVQVHEAGAHDVPRSVDYSGGLQVGSIAPVNSDPLALNRHRPEIAGAAGAIDNKAVFYQQVKHLLPPSAGWRLS